MFNEAIDTPLGKLQIKANRHHLLAVQYAAETISDMPLQPNAITHETVRQLQEYFSGCRQSFEVAWTLAGTPFQHQVWQQLNLIPYGSTIPYGKLAQLSGHPHAYQAIGQACKANPLAIIIPCHRVIGQHQRLSGYNGGRDRKQWLLQHEATDNDLPLKWKF